MFDYHKNNTSILIFGDFDDNNNNETAKSIYSKIGEYDFIIHNIYIGIRSTKHNKSNKKLTPYNNSKNLPIDISLIISEVEKMLNWLEVNDNLKEFDWTNFKKIDIK